jgi:RNA polymerase sigma factor (TIGR02999 family)
MSDVTQLLAAAAAGDSHAAAELLPLVYDELRALAAARMAAEKPGQTLQATALVHEAYVRLVVTARPPGGEAGGREPVRWDSRRHFFAAAAEAMRRILLDRARDKRRLKRGGGWRRLRLDQIDRPVDETSDDVLALDEALGKLAREDPLCADLVKLRFFAGLTQEEAAAALGIARRSADRSALSGSPDGTIRLWDLATGKEIRRFAGHETMVLSVAFSPDGRHVLSGGCDTTVRLWDVQSGKQLGCFRGHRGNVESVAFSPDGCRALSGSADGTIRLWDLPAGRELCGLGTEDVLGVAFSPDGRQVLSANADSMVRLWNLPGDPKEKAVDGKKPAR